MANHSAGLWYTPTRSSSSLGLQDQVFVDSVDFDTICVPCGLPMAHTSPWLTLSLSYAVPSFKFVGSPWALGNDALPPWRSLCLELDRCCKSSTTFGRRLCPTFTRYKFELFWSLLSVVVSTTCSITASAPSVWSPVTASLCAGTALPTDVDTRGTSCWNPQGKLFVSGHAALGSFWPTAMPSPLIQVRQPFFCFWSLYGLKSRLSE